MNSKSFLKSIGVSSTETERANKRKKKLVPVLPSNISFIDAVQISAYREQRHKQLRSHVNNSNLSFVSDTNQVHKYNLSPVTGGKLNIYPVAPIELLEPDISTNVDIEKKNLLVYYFETLYPLTRSSGKWRKMDLKSLQEYYDNMQFWYIFNTAWTSSPMPVTLSDSVYKNWEKCTFFQANTVVQSAITSWGLGVRGNNGTQDGVKSSFTYIGKDGNSKTINTVSTDRDYWDVACGTKMEVTSWGWNPYPFGIYAQGPFTGTGNFLQIAKQGLGGAIVGTSHWDIIFQCKSDDAKDSDVWTSIFNHELHDGNVVLGSPASLVYNDKYINVTPWVVVHDLRTDTYQWSGILGVDLGGYTPILIAYFLWYVGGYGGIGGVSPFDKTWTNKNYLYTPLYVITTDGKLAFPEDQSIPSSAGLPGGFNRNSDEFWIQFRKFFSLIQAWDTDWTKEKWRHPVLKSWDGTEWFDTVGPSVVNPSDSLMQAYATGNFNIVKWSTWLDINTNPPPTLMGTALGAINPSLSKFSKNPAKWSYYQTPDGQVMKSKTGLENGFPVGVMTSVGGGYNFVIRSQMPNVNYDICTEFADFRVSTPGQLATGLGDQSKWKELFTIYAQNYMFTADPDDTSTSHSFTGEFGIRLPDTDLLTSNPNIENWRIDNNVASGKTFFGFDVLSGMWDSNPYISGMSNNTAIMLNQDTGSAPSGGSTVNIFASGTCTNTVGPNLIPPASFGIDDIAGGMGATTAVTTSKYSKSKGCKPYSYNSYSPITNAPSGTKYFPSAGDSFAKGVVGMQANGSGAQLGSSQTRWIMSSKGIAWDYSAPLSNRLQLLRGAGNLQKINNSIRNIFITSLVFIIVVGVISIVLFLRSDKVSYKTRYSLFSSLAITGVIGIILLLTAVIKGVANRKAESYLSDDVVNDEAHRLRTYFALVYPMVPVSRWNSMSLDELRTFFCSLHWWYKGDGLPSPLDYINTKYWTETVPFGKGSSWKSFCMRKNCVVNVSPSAYNETDGKICVGYDKSIVSTTQNESPSAIIWNGRQLQSLGAQSQQTTFFHPSNNYHIDTYNNFPTVNDTGLEEWQKVKYVEVSSQWGPFPDGIYYDWAPGTGVWLSLDKHAVGYTGLDLIRRMGNEAMQNNVDLVPIYQEAWQKTGLSTMSISTNNKLTLPKIFWPDAYAGFGWYGSVIMSKSQNNQIAALAKTVNLPASQGTYVWSVRDNVYGTADGDLYKQLATYVKPQYLAEGSDGKWLWTNTKPSDPSYIENYPLPLPYFTTFQGDGKGLPKINPLAIRIPWEYQLFNICQMMRILCIDLLFLDEAVVDTSSPQGLEYVDWLKANKKNPLKQARTWEVAINKCIKLMSTPNAHPLFLNYPRIYSQNGSGDGPQFILVNEPQADLLTVQVGALDDSKYSQTVSTNGGVTYVSQTEIPQNSYANLEIDHWLPMLGRPMGYKACVRIQHWCGNKGLALDIEIINISQQISGNLISNMPTDSLYEVWKKGGEERLSVRDPFANDSHVYSNDGPVHNLRQKYHPWSPKHEDAKWTAPPWIEYYPNVDMSQQYSNIYGWPAENLMNFMTTNRLSYCPANAQQVTLSGSYPEYNKIIFENMVKDRTILQV